MFIVYFKNIIIRLLFCLAILHATPSLKAATLTFETASNVYDGFAKGTVIGTTTQKSWVRLQKFTAKTDISKTDNWMKVSVNVPDKIDRAVVIKFMNDLHNKHTKQDRNLFIRNIKLNGIYIAQKDLKLSGADTTKFQGTTFPYTVKIVAYNLAFRNKLLCNQNRLSKNQPKQFYQKLLLPLLN